MVQARVSESSGQVVMVESPSNRELRDVVLVGDPVTVGALLDARAVSQADDPMFKEALGLFKIRIGARDEGQALLEEVAATRAHEADPRSLTILLRAAFGSQQLDKALSLVERVLVLAPDSQPALRTAARIHMKTGDHGRAEEYWRRLCEASIDKREPAIQVARLARGREDWRTQAEFADLALMQDPDDAEAIALATQARMRSRVVSDLPRLMPALYRHDPERVHGYLRSLSGADMVSVLAEVLVALAEAGARDPIVAQISEDSPRQWIAAGRRAAKARKRELAARMFKAALHVEPTSRDAIEGLDDLARADLIAMRSALKGGDEISARDHAESVVQINPTATEAWAALGRILLGKDPDRALDCLRKCVQLEPDDPWSLLNLGRALDEAGRLAEAADIYDRLAAIESTDGKSHRIDALKSAASVRRTAMRRAREAFADRRLDEAWDLCLVVLQGSDAAPGARVLTEAIKRGKLLAIREQYAQRAPGLVAAAEQYLEHDPGQKEVMVYLGRTFFADRLYERALPVWTELARLEPGDAYFQAQIARCCKILRLPEQGAIAAANAIRLDPTADASEALRKAYGLSRSPADDPAGAA